MATATISTEATMFRDREEAAGRLAQELKNVELTNPLVLGIPRGGVVIAASLASAIGAEMDVALARKLRAPFQPELAIGAVSEGGEVHLNRNAELAGANEAYLEKERQERLAELEERRRLYRQARPAAPIEGRSVILTDDGIATGSTMLAAADVVKAKNPRELIIAVPVMPAAQVDMFRETCDRLVCLSAPRDFFAIGQFYGVFAQVDDETVCDLLRRSAAAESKE